MYANGAYPRGENVLERSGWRLARSYPEAITMVRLTEWGGEWIEQRTEGRSEVVERLGLWRRLVLTANRTGAGPGARREVMLG
jgi:hypothetical protein